MSLPTKILSTIKKWIHPTEVIVWFKKSHPDAYLPNKANKYDAGWDVYATEDVTIEPGDSKIVPIGLILADATHGHYIDVRCRSGMGFKYNMDVHPGLVDSDLYRGELGILLRNLDFIKKRTYHVKKGDKVAQLVVNKNLKSDVRFSDTVTKTIRGSNGFGSTGR